MSVSQRVANAVVNKLAPKIWSGLTQRFIGFHLLNERGMKDMGGGTKAYQWAPLTERIPTLSFSDGNQIDYTKHRENSQAIIPYRELVTPEQLSQTEIDSLRGDYAVGKYATEVGKRIRESMMYELGRQLFNDGGDGTVNDGTGLHGLASMTNTATFGGTSKTGTPTATYAGISTALDAFTADTTNDAYGAWSPALVDATASDWTGSTDDWATHCLRAIRLAGTKISNKMGEASADGVVVLLNQNDWTEFLDRLDSDYGRFDYGQANPELAKLGFSKQVEWGGLVVAYDHFVPTGEAFLMNPSKGKIVCPTNDLITMREDYDMTYKARLILANFYGNFVWTVPSCFGKIKTA